MRCFFFYIYIFYCSAPVDWFLVFIFFACFALEKERAERVYIYIFGLTSERGRERGGQWMLLIAIGGGEKKIAFT